MIMIRNNFKKYKVADSPTGRLAPLHLYVCQNFCQKNFKINIRANYLTRYDDGVFINF